MRREIAGKLESSRVPRYTSYPTAPSFDGRVTAGTYASWLGAIAAGEAVSLYLHVPFCHQLCWYCGCNTTITHDQTRVDAYMHALHRELALVAEHLPAGLRLGHLHWGGGTPSIVGSAGFGEAMQAVARHFEPVAGAERAIELDPRHLDAPTMDALAAHGIDRASLGVQTFDPGVQRAINRVQSEACTARAVEGLRDRGVRGISFDLLYGLPHQTPSISRTTALAVADMAPDRGSVFGYAHLPGRMRHQRMIDDAALADAEGRWAQFEAIEEVLLAAGYVQIGLDHFARPDDSMARAVRTGTLRRNFQGYTTDTSAVLLGLGSSAIGGLPQGHVQNHTRLPEWRRAIDAGRLPTARGYALSPQERIDRDTIETIMCRGNVDLAAIADRHAVPLARCEPVAERFAALETMGAVTRRGTRIEVAPSCRPLWRMVASAFDRHLDPATTRHAPAV